MTTATCTQKFATIIADDIPAIKPLTAWLQSRGYHCRRIAPADVMNQPSIYHSHLIVTDIANSNSDSLNILDYVSRINPTATLVPLCFGGNTPAMRRARSIGVTGFLYLDTASGMIDFHRGFARSLDIQSQSLRQFLSGRQQCGSHLVAMPPC